MSLPSSEAARAVRRPIRILFATAPLPGHFFPLVPLAWACRAAGHEVQVMTSSSFVPTVAKAGLPAVASGPAADFTTLIPRGATRRGSAERSRTHGQVLGGIAAANLPGALRMVSTWRPDLVVAERAESSGPIAAARHGVPFAEFHWGIPSLSNLRDAAAEVLAGKLADAGLDGMPEPAMVINPWAPSLWRSHTTGHHSVRHVQYDGDSTIPDWIFRPRRRRRLCLTLGTMIPRIPGERLPHVVGPLLDQLTRLGLEVVVAVDNAVASEWQPLPDGVLHVGRVPLSHAFKVSDCAIHHGGNGTSLTAMSAGLPQLVLPQFDDQFDNAQAVVRAGAGLMVRPAEIAAEDLAGRCLDLLETRAFGDAATEVAAEMAAQPSPAEIVGKLARLARAGRVRSAPAAVYRARSAALGSPRATAI